MLPPATVQIKRKRTDDPVDLLRKCHRLEVSTPIDKLVQDVQNEIGGPSLGRRYVFKRQRVSSAGTTASSITPSCGSTIGSGTAASSVALTANGIPQVQVSKPGDELRYPYGRRHVGRNPQPQSASGAAKDEDVAGNTGSLGSNDASVLQPPHSYDTKLPASPQAPRRFHLSRSSILPSSNNGFNDGQRGAKHPVAIFMERRDPSVTHDVEATKSRSVDDTRNSGTPISRKASAILRNESLDPYSGLTPVTAGKISITPSSSLRAGQNQTSAPVSQSTLGQRDLTQVEKGINIATPTSPLKDSTFQTTSNRTNEQQKQPSTMSEEDGSKEDKSAPKSTKSPLKFKPKRLTRLKYLQQEQEQQEASQNSPTNEDTEMLDAADDYVVDTYIRVPISSKDPSPDPTSSQPLDATPIPEPTSYGYLVLDTQDDLDDFFINEWSNSDDGYPFEDEDEDPNSENWPGNDYPEDPSDDEDGDKDEDEDEDDENNNDEDDEPDWSEDEDRVSYYRRRRSDSDYDDDDNGGDMDEEDDDDDDDPDLANRMQRLGFGPSTRPWMPGYVKQNPAEEEEGEEEDDER